MKKYNQRTYMRLGGALLISMLTTGSLLAKPNVLFIAVDDLNDFPSFNQCYPDAITPNMDSLAKRGMVFANAHCQFPVCGPSRASVMSGLHPSTLGFDSNMKKNEELPNRVLELNAELIHTYFRRNGYKTMAVGKLSHRRLLEGSVDVDGGRGSFTAGTGKLKENWPQNGTSTDWAMAPERDDQLADYEAAEWAANQLEGEHDKPFFLMVGFLRPHVPWYVPKKWYDLYDKTKLTLPPYREDDLDDVPEVSKSLNRSAQMPSTDWAIQNNKWRDILHAYLACVSFVDHQVGKVLEALEASPYKDNTIVVFWSDHGYHMGEKNTFQKQTLWERSSHVPLIIDAPSIGTGGRCDRVVSLLDIYPTLVELCSLPRNPKNEGRSLVPLLNTPSKSWPYPAITGWQESSFAVQDERYRYIRYNDGSEELYDHQNDPNEWTNIAGHPELAGIKAKLAKHIPQTNIREPVAQRVESVAPEYGPDQETIDQYLLRMEAKAKKKSRAFDITATETRFKEMDADQDGIVTRKERRSRLSK